MIKVVILDDHAIVRGGLKHLFDLSLDIKLVGEAENCDQLVQFLNQNVVDMLLVDLTVPGLSGVELIAYLHANYPQYPLLVLSMHAELPIVYSVLKAGADGYITKDSDSEKTLVAIRKVANGGRFIDPNLAERMIFDHQLTDENILHAKLSSREFQIFEMLANGKPINKIAEELGISNKTVSTYKARLFEKLEISCHSELIRYYDANIKKVSCAT